MTFTANAAATTAQTIAYSASALTGVAAATSVAAGTYTVAATSGGRSVEVQLSVDRGSTRTRSLPTSIPAVVDPLSSQTSATTLAAANGSKRGKRAATSQWDL